MHDATAIVRKNAVHRVGIFEAFNYTLEMQNTRVLNANSRQMVLHILVYRTCDLPVRMQFSYKQRYSCVAGMALGTRLQGGMMNRAILGE